MAEQFQLPNGMFSISPELTAWVDDQRRAGRSDDEIMSQMRRVVRVLQPLRDAAAEIGENVTRTETEFNLGWATANPELFAESVVAFQKKAPATGWTHHVDLDRSGFMTLIAVRKPDVSSIAFSATVGWDKIVNAIIGAIEGASGYWMREYNYLSTPEGFDTEKNNPRYASEEFWQKGGLLTVTYDNPNEGEESLSRHISESVIRSGLRTMAEKDPGHFGDLLSENDDAITHDVFIQHVVFGEVIYG